MFTQEQIDALRPEMQDSMMGILGIELCPSTDDTVRGTMPVTRATSRPPGILNGGASLALAETLAGYGSYSILGSHTGAFGIQVSANHISVARMGDRIVGVARPVHIGRSTHIWQVDITSEATGRLVSSIRVVNFVANIGL